MSWSLMASSIGSFSLGRQRQASFLDMLHVLQAFVFLVILVFFNDWGMPHVPEAFHVIEFFSGAGNVGKSCRWAGHPTAQLDIAMGVRMKAKKQNAFDMSTPAGLAQLAFQYFPLN